MSINWSRRLYDALLVLLLLFVADLFLAWHRTGVEVAGVMWMHAGGSGWAGWGGVAGVVALVLIVLELGLARRVPRALAPTLALGMLAATIAAVATGTHVAAAAVAVDAGAARWPAWVGLVLAVLAVVVAVAAFLAEAEQRTSRTSNPPHGATP